MNNYYDKNGCDLLDEKIYGANPTGFVDFNKSRYNWVTSIYDLMMANTWFPSEVNITDEFKNFKALNDNEQGLYELTFAQLSFNDSAQENYLADFRSLATNSLVKSTITLQMMQEGNHSKSYSTLLDAAGNSEEVFNMYKTNDALDLKNKMISEEFAKNITGNSADKMLLSAMASVNLEGVYFLTGFGYIYILGDKVPGARDMIQFIARDELNTHLPLFNNIFKTIKNENKIKAETIDKCYKMMDNAVNIELAYSEYLLENYPVLGLTSTMIENTVHNYANIRLQNIGLNSMFNTTPKTTMQMLVDKHLNINDIKSNFFESNVKAYSKDSLNMDF